MPSSPESQDSRKEEKDGKTREKTHDGRKKKEEGKDTSSHRSTRKAEGRTKKSGKEDKKERSRRKRSRSRSRSRARREKERSSRRSSRKKRRRSSRSRSRSSRRSSRRRDSSRRRRYSSSRGRSSSRRRYRSRSRSRSPRAFDKDAVLQAVIGGRLPLPSAPPIAPAIPSQSVHPHRAFQQQQQQQLFVPIQAPAPTQPLYMDDASMQATRPSRRLYVGNLPVSMQPALSEPALLEFFRAAVQAVGVKTPDPLLSVWLSSERTFCFLEFRSVQDSSACLNLLQGIQLGGRVLRIGRPADYSAPPPGLQNFIAGHPPGSYPPPSLSEAVNTGETAGTAGLGALAGAGLLPTSPPGVPAPENPIISNLLVQQEPPGDNPSRVLVLFNLLVCPEVDPNNPNAQLTLLPNELTSDPEGFLDLLMDVREQCEKLLSSKPLQRPSSEDGVSGSEDDSSAQMTDDEAAPLEDTLSVIIPLPPDSQAVLTPEKDEGPVLKDWSHAGALGRVFVRFGSQEQAIAARSGLQGLKYFGRIVQVGFYDPKALERGEYHLPLLS